MLWGYEDALTAWNAGARRIELNSGSSVGGLTPNVSTLRIIKQETDLKVICMIRCREAGFSYSEYELKQMFVDAEELLRNGADGLAFGFLNEDHTINEEETSKMCDLIHKYDKKAVFHRACDCCRDHDEAMGLLVRLGVDRVLTSGGYSTAIEGKKRIRHLQEKYGHQIQILAGSGINDSNVQDLINCTHIHQLHASCKYFRKDPTTIKNSVSFGVFIGDHAYDHLYVDRDKITDLIEAVKTL